MRPGTAAEPRFDLEDRYIPSREANALLEEAVRYQDAWQAITWREGTKVQSDIRSSTRSAGLPGMVCKRQTPPYWQVGSSGNAPCRGSIGESKYCFELAATGLPETSEDASGPERQQPVG